MTKAKQLEIEFLTEEAFEPFGDIVALRSRPPDFHGIGTLIGWVIDFHTNGRTQIMFFSTRYQGLRITTLERHFNVTQTFIPMGGPQVVALAPPTDPNDVESIPTPDDVRAFLIDGTKGYVMKKGTWHSVGRFPLYPPRSDFVLITDYETTDELMHLPAEEWKLTQWVDYETRFGVIFEPVLGHRAPLEPQDR